jgi:hypothetical protein
MIAGVVKYFRFGMEEVLYDMSYTNIVMLSAAIPDWSSEGDGKGGETIDASDPKNNALVMRALGM